MLEIYWGCNAEMGSSLFMLMFGTITPSSRGLHSFKPGRMILPSGLENHHFWGVLAVIQIPFLLVHNLTGLLELPPTAAGEVGDEPEMRTGAGLRLRLLLMCAPNAFA